MLELYFIFYRIPKMMSQLARERQRNPIAWSLIGIGAWLGAEILVVFGIGVTYGIVRIMTEGDVSEIPPLLRVLTYVLALGAAIGSFLLTKRFLTSRPRPAFEPPPPPPTF